MNLSPLEIVAAEVRHIVQVSLKETVTYTVPLPVYDLLTSVMEIWPHMHGRRPKVTVERVLDALERVYPDIRDIITVERKATPPPTIRGHTATFVWHEDPLESPPLPLDPAANKDTTRGETP